MANILLIEDNQNNADYIIRILKSADHEVDHYIKGMDGAKAARAKRPDLILLDFDLPDIDGSLLILSMKRHLGGKNSPPFVAVTARTGGLDRKLASRFGFNAFVGKPFEPDELLTVVTELLNQ